MNKFIAVYRKELRIYFNSPIAYIVIMTLLAGIGYFFFQTFFLGGQASLRTFFRFAAWSFLLFGPAITMKLFAEEKKAGTIEGLLTLPIKEWHVVIGKFLASWTLLLVYLFITFVYPITISFIGDLDMGPVVGGYLGLFLLGGTFLALGVFASALTRNQVISLIVASVIGLFLFLLDVLLPFIPQLLQNLMQYIGADSHFQNISRGVLDTRDVVYSLSLMGFFLFASVQALQGRLTDHSRNWRINKFLYIGSAAGLLAALNVFSYNVYTRFDLTQERMFTLTPSSKGLMQNLQDHLLVKVFFSGNLPAPFNNNVKLLRDQLDEYRNYSSGHMSYEFIDPDVAGADGQPDKERIAEVNAAKIPKVEVNKLEKDQMQIVKVYMGLALYYQDKSETIPVVQDVSDLEYDLSSRIAKMTRDKTPKIGFLSGHGELTPSQGLEAASKVLEGKFDATEVTLAKASPLNDLDVLVIAGPKKEIPPAELFSIDQYIMSGGKVAFFLDRNDIDVSSFIGRPITTGLEPILENYGVRVKKPLILDEQNQQVAMSKAQGNMRFQTLVAFPPFIRVRDFKKDSALVKNLRDLAMPFMSPLEASGSAATVDVIARSSSKSWLFDNDDSFLVEPQMLPPMDPNDLAGPQNLVMTLSGTFTSIFKGKPIPVKEDGQPVAAEVLTQSPETRMVVIGSSAWVSDGLRNRLGYVLFANLMDWLAQDERLIGIRTRSIVNRPLDSVSEGAKNAIKYGNMFLPAIFFAAYGIVRWRLRLRRKRKGYTRS